VFHISLFTGRYPYEHGIRDSLSPPLDDHVPAPAEQFRQRGFATAAFIASAVGSSVRPGARDVYSDRFPSGLDQRPADVVTTEAIGWLTSPPKQRFFAWVHLYDPHAPYAPPEPYASRYAGRPYHGEVAFCDDQVGRIIDALRDAGTLGEHHRIATSDHGAVHTTTGRTPGTYKTRVTSGIRCLRGDDVQRLSRNCQT